MDRVVCVGKTYRHFKGKEYMYFQNEKVYECYFSGGIIK